MRLLGHHAPLATTGPMLYPRDVHDLGPSHSLGEVVSGGATRVDRARLTSRAWGESRGKFCPVRYRRRSGD